jgi:hypothetical protein
MVTQEAREPGYPATAGYLLRRRERFWLGSIIFVYALPASGLTLTTIGYVNGVSSVAEVIYFGLFLLLAVVCSYWMWKERAAVAGQVLLTVDEGGVYLADPPRRIPCREVAGLVAFRALGDGDDGDPEWLSRLVVVRPGEDCLPGAVEWRPSSPDQWGAVVDLHHEKLRLGKLAAAVHAYAPGLPVWDAGKVKNPGEVRNPGEVTPPAASGNGGG